MACNQDQILSWSKTWDDYLTVPFNKAKKQDGLHDRMKICMVRCSNFVAWDLIQGVHSEATALEQAEPHEAEVTELGSEEQAQASDHADWWQNQEQWHADHATDQTWSSWHGDAADSEQHDAEHRQSHRNGFEPKVISLLVNFYRYAKDQRGKSWDKLMTSANTVYNARINISRQVDRILWK